MKKCQKLIFAAGGEVLRLWFFVVLLGSLLGGIEPANAASAEATDAAFGALLSMPGAKPAHGKWIVPDQYAVAFDDQSELIERLKELKKQGADFNAMRHRGTLLAHAIRAELLDRTALWLLRNGAKTKSVVFDSTKTAYDLAREYERPALVKVLENDFGFRAPRQTTVETKNAVNPKPAAPKSKVDEAIALLTTLMTAPYPDKARQQTWQRFAATLSDVEFTAVFKDGRHVESLIRLARDVDGALEKALLRLPIAVLRQNAQQIADLMAEMSEVSYSENGGIRYAPASHAWPTLWQRITQPLRYDSRPDLAERIPPRLWPALFASGYAQQDAAFTGCLLSSVDLAGLKALWPDFQRFFSNARQAAPALVLSQYRPSFDPQACGYGSSPAQTIDKLTFLKQQGVQAKISGISKIRLKEAGNSALAAAIGPWLSTTLLPPKLVEVAPRCELALNEAWFDKLIKTPLVGWGIPAGSVQIIAVPGYAQCGLLVSGQQYPEAAEVSDSFYAGPSRAPYIRCPDLPDDSDIWIENAGSIQAVKSVFDTREGLIVGQVMELESGKNYLLRSTAAPSCSAMPWSLPQPYEWQAGVLHPARDADRIGRLLAGQCEELEAYEAPKCRGFFEVADSERESTPQREAVLAVLRQGRAVSVLSLINTLGVERRHAYAAAIAGRDREAHNRLVAEGIPPHWTVAEIISLGQSNMPLAEKRQRIALLFSLKDQLALALNSKRYDLPEALLSWLPRQDWGPVWRAIGQQPDIWWNAAGSLRTEASEKGRKDLLCDIDRAQGFLCGGGIEFD